MGEIAQVIFQEGRDMVTDFAEKRNNLRLNFTIWLNHHVPLMDDYWFHLWQGKFL